MKKVLITGGAGFIGSNLALKLASDGYKVVVLDNLSPQIHGKDVGKSYTYGLIKNTEGIKFIKGSVTNSVDWDKALKDVNVVVHLAAETGTGQSMYEVEKYTNVNIGGTAILLDKLVNNKNLKVKKLIVASSRAIYGEGKYKCEIDGIVYPESRIEKDMKAGDFSVKCPICGKSVTMLPTDEESKSHPESVYGYTKKVQEEMSILVGKSIGLPVLAFRFQNVYGPGQSLKNPYTGILSIFSTQIKNGNDINIFEDGKESRDFVYIDDITNALLLGIKKGGAGTGVYNVGSDEETDVLTIANTLKEKYGSSIGIGVTGNFRLGDIRANIADLSRTKRDLGYEPRTDFKQGISNFVDWVENQEIEIDNYDKSIGEMKAKGLYK
jgi:dTDP-L-rhamnose 4-epimerase